MAANQEDSSKAHTNMVAHAVAEAAIPGANTVGSHQLGVLPLLLLVGWLAACDALQPE